MPKKRTKRGRPPGPARPGTRRALLDRQQAAEGNVTVGEAAEILGVAPTALYKQIQRGELREGLHFVKVTFGPRGVLYFRKAAVEALARPGA